MKNNLKVGILTQPLQDNYGGLLQAYALKEILKNLEHEVTIINRRTPKRSQWRILASDIKQRIKRTNLKSLSDDQVNIISKNTNIFREKYIPELSGLITSDKGMRKLNKDKFDAFIVGSDQCWRPLYSPKITNYFLDFAKNSNRVKKISYAASFGTPNWEFSKKQTRKCKKLLKKFDTVSVREKSGIELVRKNLGRDDALHVLDPTMLLTANHYRGIVQNECSNENMGSLKVYVLDKSEKKTDFINRLTEYSGLKKFEVMPQKRFKDGGITKQNIQEFQYPSPALWLKGFDSADFVITDSFHGTLFSILFNVPFITIGNNKRGIARFISILEMFSLSDRLITDVDCVDLKKIFSSEIDWKPINMKIEAERAKSLKFLTDSLE